MTPTDEIIGGCICALVGSLAGYWLDLGKSRILKHESDTKADKLELIPLLDGFIQKASHYPAPNIVREECIRGLADWHLRFRIHLKGRRLTDFNTAWQTLEQTTEQEMIGDSKTGVFSDADVEDFRKVTSILMSRLHAVLDCVERA